VDGERFTTAQAAMKKWHLSRVHGVSKLPARQWGGQVEYTVWGSRNSDSRAKLWEHVVAQLQAAPFPGGHLPVSADDGRYGSMDTATGRTVMVRCQLCHRRLKCCELPLLRCDAAAGAWDAAAARARWDQWRKEAQQMLKDAKKLRYRPLRTRAEQGRHMSRLQVQRRLAQHAAAVNAAGSSA
jgi:hypothetical protein